MKTIEKVLNKEDLQCSFLYYIELFKKICYPKMDLTINKDDQVINEWDANYIYHHDYKYKIDYTLYPDQKTISSYHMLAKKRNEAKMEVNVSYINEPVFKLSFMGYNPCYFVECHMDSTKKNDFISVHEIKGEDYRLFINHQYTLDDIKTYLNRREAEKYYQLDNEKNFEDALEICSMFYNDLNDINNVFTTLKLRKNLVKK